MVVVEVQGSHVLTLSSPQAEVDPLDADTEAGHQLPAAAVLGEPDENKSTWP